MAIGIPTPRGQERRRTILDAALNCFIELGYETAGIQDICRRSGSSVGSVYHFFGSKEGLALALYAEGLQGWSDAVLDLSVEDRPPERIVRAMVARSLEWIVAHPRQARFLAQAAWLEPIAGNRAETAATVTTMRRRGTALLAYLVAQGEVRALPWDLFQAQVLGPARDYALAYLNGAAETDPAEAARALGEAAWRAVRAS